MSGPPSFLHCRLAQGSVVLPLSCIRGLEGIGRLQRLPRPGPLAGWLLGAEPEAPVYDLSVLLGLPPTRPGRETTVVLYGCQSAASGLLVEAVIRTEVAAASVLARPRLLDRPDLAAWAGAISVEGDLVPWLDPSRLHADLAACGPPREARAPAARRPLPRPPGAPAPAIVTFEALGEADGRGSDRGAGSSFALSLSQVVEVVDLAAPVPLPGGPGFLLGLVEWRGRAVPVVDLSVLLDGLPRGSAAPRRAIIARTLDPTDCVALAAAGEIRMRRLPLAGRLLEPPAGARGQGRGALLGCVEIDGRSVRLPDLEHLLSAECEGFGRAA
jgi:chemotaxis signal transduction protein